MTGERWRPSAVLLAISGLLVSGVGLYFLFIRPPLLPRHPLHGVHGCRNCVARPKTGTVAIERLSRAGRLRLGNGYPHHHLGRLVVSGAQTCRGAGCIAGRHSVDWPDGHRQLRHQLRLQVGSRNLRPRLGQQPRRLRIGGADRPGPKANRIIS